MKLEETENSKLQYVNNIHTTTSKINDIHDSDTELAEKITQILNIYEKNPNFKGKPAFKKWYNYCRRYGHSTAEYRQKRQDIQNKPQKHREPRKSFYQYMKRPEFTKKKFHSNNISEKTLPDNYNNLKTTITLSKYLSQKICRSKKFAIFLTIQI